MTHKPKKRLTQQQEFDIMKLVLDKMLWVATALVLFGLWNSFMADAAQGLTFILVGCIIFVMFLVLIVKEYEIVK